MNYISQLITQHRWVFNVFLLIVGALLIWFLLSRVRNYLLPRLERSARSWDATLVTAISLPIRILLLFMVVMISLQILARHIGVLEGFKSVLHLIQRLGVVLSIFWFCIRYISGVESHLLYVKLDITRKRDRTSVRAISQVVRVVLVLIIFLVLLQVFGYPINTLLAFGGVGALAVSFAAKDTLANFFGGMMIFWDKPFSVGDWIRSPDQNIEGDVDHIGWRLTRIITFDKRPLYVPNALFSNMTVENPSRMSHRRINVTVGLRYDDAQKIAPILADIETMLREHTDIDETQTLMVKFDEFGASSLNFFIYTFTRTTDWVTFQSVKQDVLLKAIDIIASHGAECAFPTTTLNVPQPILTKTTTGEIKRDR